MKVKILSAQEKIFEGEAVEVILPADGGEISVLDFHEPCLCRLRSGEIKVRTGKDEQQKFGALSGIAKIFPREVMIFLEK